MADVISVSCSRGKHEVASETMAAEQVESNKEQKVDPWTVHAAEGEATIDYDKLIGTGRDEWSRVTTPLLSSSSNSAVR